MKKIFLPTNVELTRECLEGILEQYNQIDDDETEVVLDFSKTTWFDGELTTFLGVLSGQLFRRNVTVYTQGITGRIQTILGKNGFLKLHGLGDVVEDTYHSTIPYIIINSNEVKTIKNYLEEKVFPKINQHIDYDELILIQEAVFELLQNVKDHSGSNKVVLCGQYFHRKKKIELAFSDLGITIPGKVETKFESPSKDFKYIDWATLRGNSTKKMRPSGLGLFDIRDSIQGIGKMTIVSRKGYWAIDSDGSIESLNLTSPFPGTLINLTFYLKGSPNRNRNNNQDDHSDAEIFF